MCKERASPKCCIDNLLLIMIIVICMLLYIYIVSKNPGLIAIIVVMTVFSLIVFSVRLEECGFPDWIKNCKYVCKDMIIGEQDEDEEVQEVETKENHPHH